MINVASNDQIRDMDKMAIEQYLIPGIILMENAGRNTSEAILELCDEYGIDSVVILAGKGNNGGDGFVIARYLDKSDLNVHIFLAADEKSVKGDAKINLEICKKSHISITLIDKIEQIVTPKSDFIIIDALLGTGVKGPIKGFYADLITWVNDQDTIVCSIDMPSGISGDSIEITDIAVEADYTFTMGLPKLSQFFYPVRYNTGDLEIIDIGYPDELEIRYETNIRAVFKEDIILDYPDPSIHKHKAGRVFILGGSPGMTGAITLSSKAASISGAGLVVVGVAETLNSIMEEKLTEQMSLPLNDNNSGLILEASLEQINDKVEWCDVLLIGPGIGRNRETGRVILKCIQNACDQKKKVIIDADALFILAHNPDILTLLGENCVITPHYGEFARFDPSYKKILASAPWQALSDFNKKFQCVVNLKGAPSMVGHAEMGIFINTTGNPGLAKGGSGDLLAGIIAGLAATGMEIVDASIYANFIHGLAADMAGEKWGIRSFSMDDLLNELKLTFRSIYTEG